MGTKDGMGMGRWENLRKTKWPTIEKHPAKKQRN